MISGPSDNSQHLQNKIRLQDLSLVCMHFTWQNANGENGDGTLVYSKRRSISPTPDRHSIRFVLDTDDDNMTFARDRHIRYWRMCAKILPHHYISNDCSRMTLGFFIISALDLLGSLDDIDRQERQGWVEWIYQCQIPGGGFRGSTTTDLRDLRSRDNASWDPANISFTFFALVSLLILGDNLTRVERDKCLLWLPRLQRGDGSFGESLSEFETIEGDRDLRHCYCAAGIAFILQKRQYAQKPSFDEDGLIRYIQSCQDLSGGFGVSPFREPHSGLSYCGIGALAFVQCLRQKPRDQVVDLIPDAGRCLKWLLDRQTTFVDEDEENDNGKVDCESEDDLNQNATSSTLNQPATICVAGFNGREAKIADTCYAFWNTGALAVSTSTAW